MTRAFLTALVLACTGCGGDVDLGGGPSGGGGATSGGVGGTQTGTGGAVSGGGGSAAGGSAGTGASGGVAPVACGGLKRTGDPIAISNDDESAFPTLVRVSSGAAVVYRRAGLGPPPGFEVLSPAWSDPWTGAWGPPPPTSNKLTGLSNVYEHTVQAAEGAIAGSVVVLHPSADNACMSLSRVIPKLETLAGFGCPPPMFTHGPNPSALVAAPAAPSGGETYVAASVTGYGGAIPTNYQLNVARVDVPAKGAPGSVTSPFDALGCATAAMYARAWRSPTAGVVMALTTSRPFLSCLEDQYADGPPTRLQIVGFGPGTDLTKTQLLHELVLPHAILSLAIAPRSGGGAWVVFQAATGTSTTSPPGPVQALALDASGKPTTSIKSVASGPTGLGPSAPASYAATALGNRLVVAGSWDSSDCKWCPGLRIYVVDESSPDNAPPMLVAAPSSVMISSPISLLASPDGARFIAAYSDWTGNPTDVWAERFECVP